MRKRLLSLLAAVGIVLGVAAPSSPAQAYASYRGNGCVSVCGPVHAYSYSTPTYGHLHYWSRCITVRIDYDWGDYVSVTASGYWRS